MRTFCISRIRPALLAAIAFSTAGCSISRINPEEALAAAEAYRTHRWAATSSNRFHGSDPDGVWVQTPDALTASNGWWVENGVNVGVPYKWGGFDTIAQFDAKIRKGRPAGDLYTLEKRRLLEAGESRYAAGVDCSGFVSRCLKLDRHYSTRELPLVCEPVPSFEAMQPGDIINSYNDHVMLFAGFEVREDGKLRAVVYQAGTDADARVTRNAPTLDYLRAKRYHPLRYRGMKTSHDVRRDASRTVFLGAPTPRDSAPRSR